MKQNISNDENPYKDLNLGLILFVLLFGMFVTILNQTSLNVALPVIMEDLSIDPTTAQWLMTGFMLVNGILIPISAFFVTRFGFRKLFLTAVISFTLGSFVCAISDTFTLLMTGRIIQAVGAGILMPLGMNVFMTIFPPERRGAAMGTMGIAMILGPAIGPTLSGWVIQNYDWNLMFYGMTVIGIIDVIFAFMWFKLPSKTSKLPIDLLGILYSTLGFGLLLFGFSEAGTEGWGSNIVIFSLIIGVIFITLFSIRQLRVENPILELRVLKSKTFSFTLVINSIITMALFGAMLLLPIYLQSIRGFTPLEAGILMLPGALIMGLMGPIAGKFFDKYGVRILAVIGLIITTFATWEFTKLTDETTYKTLLLLYSLRSFGMSLLMMPIMTAGMNALPQNVISHGTAMTNTIRQIAGSIGTAILITIMTTQTTTHTEEMVNDYKSNATVQSVDAATQKMLEAKIVKEATIQGINDAFHFATIVALVALFLAFFLKTPKVKKEQEETEKSLE